MWADHGTLYCITCISLIWLEHIQKGAAGNIPAGSLLAGRDVNLKWIKYLGYLPHWIALIWRPIHLLKLQTLSSYNSCSCRYCWPCRPCRGIIHARKQLFRENMYHYSIFYTTFNTNPSFLVHFKLTKAPCHVLLKSLPCRRQLQANEEWQACCYPGGWGPCLNTHMITFLMGRFW